MKKALLFPINIPGYFRSRLAQQHPIRLFHGVIFPSSQITSRLCYFTFCQRKLFLTIWWLSFFRLLRRLPGKIGPQSKSWGVSTQPGQNLQDWKEAGCGRAECRLLREPHHLLPRPQRSRKNHHHASSFFLTGGRENLLFKGGVHFLGWYMRGLIGAQCLWE